MEHPLNFSDLGQTFAQCYDATKDADLVSDHRCIVGNIEWSTLPIFNKDLETTTKWHSPDIMTIESVGGDLGLLTSWFSSTVAKRLGLKWKIMSNN